MALIGHQWDKWWFNHIQSLDLGHPIPTTNHNKPTCGRIFIPKLGGSPTASWVHVPLSSRDIPPGNHLIVLMVSAKHKDLRRRARRWKLPGEIWWLVQVSIDAGNRLQKTGDEMLMYLIFRQSWPISLGHLSWHVGDIPILIHSKMINPIQPDWWWM